MAASPITLDEAAERLGLRPEEFKRRLKTDAAFAILVPIRDGTTLRFKPEKVDELARELGAGSNPENPLPSLAESNPVTPADEPLVFDSSDSDDVFALSPDDPNKPGRGDSDVRLEAPGSGKGKPNRGGDLPTEEISIELAGPGSAVIKGGSSAKLSAPKSAGKLTSDSGRKLAPPGAGDSSEFELSLDADSDDFELKLNPDPTSDEVDLGDAPKDKSAAASARRGGESGILSRKPNDSGPSLEKGKAGAAPEDSDSDLDFELTLDSSAAVSGTKLGGSKAGGKKAPADSDSEFELTLDDSGGSSLEHAALGGDADKGDIFETDFEIPPMDESGSGEVALDSSDPDVEVDVAADEDVAVEDGGGEVVLEEDDEAPRARGRAKRPAPADDGDVDLADEDDLEEDQSAARALQGAKGRRRGEEDEEDEEELAAAGAGAYRPVPWGPLPAVLLLLVFPLVLLGGLMSFELLQTVWGYQQPRKPTAPLVRSIANNLDMELRDQ